MSNHEAIRAAYYQARREKKAKLTELRKHPRRRVLSFVPTDQHSGALLTLECGHKVTRLMMKELPPTLCYCDQCPIEETSK